MPTRERPKIYSEINVTPLVDVVLVLLIIFMVITPLLQQGYDLTTPRGRQSTADGIVVSVEGDGSIHLNRDLIGAGKLEKKLSNLLRNRSTRTVFFAAPDEANYGHVVFVLDTVRGAGASPIGVVPFAPAESGIR